MLAGSVLLARWGPRTRRGRWFLLALPAGGVTADPVELAQEHYFVKVLEKGTRPLDPDQVPDIRASAFSDWYTPKKDQAKTDDVIVIAGETEDETDLEPGSD